MRASASALLLAFVLVLVDLGAQVGGTITGTVLVRERENGDHSLLVAVESQDKVNRLQFTLPSRFTFQPGWVPPNWSFTQDGREIVLAGDPLFRLNLRLDTSRNANLIEKVQGKQVELEAGTPASQRLTRFKVKVDALPRVRRIQRWEELVSSVFPPEVTPGAPVFVTFPPPFNEGAWVPDFNPVPDRSLSKEDLALRRIREAASKIEAMTKETSAFFRSLALNPPEGPPAQTSSMLFNEPPASLTFFDRYLESLVELIPPWKEVPPATCDVAIAGGTPLAFAGQDACVSGCFPSGAGGLEEAARLLMLDGDKPLVPKAGSPTTIVVRIPSDTPPGQHFITWKPGGAATGQLQFGVLQMEGTIDQNQLWRGQSTTMRLRIVGSDRPLPLNIINRTPAVIQIDGGERQVVTTSGGADNVATRQVKGIMKGNFTIDYSLDQPPCGGGR